MAAYRVEKSFLRDPPHAALSTPVRHFMCPSDERVREARSLRKDGAEKRAFTSYLGVNGTNAFREDGVLYLESKVRLVEITDGTSNTLMIGERPPSADLVFGWWYAGWGQDKDGEGDMVLGTRSRNHSIWGRKCAETGPFEFKAGEFANQCDAFHFWSPHSGGANFAMADGSVRFLRYSASDSLSALATRASNETVGHQD